MPIEYHPKGWLPWNNSENTTKQKAMKTNYGYVVKRKARIEHECRDCSSLIEYGEEYYQVSNDFGEEDNFYISSAICEGCWNGKELNAKSELSISKEIEKYLVSSKGLAVNENDKQFIERLIDQFNIFHSKMKISKGEKTWIESITKEDWKWSIW